MKSRIQSGDVALGAMFFVLGSPAAVRIVERLAADFLIFDLEHTGWELGDLYPALETSRDSRVDSVVRVPSLERHMIARALDLGASGIMVPMIESADQAREAVYAAKYPPGGHRGYGSLFEGDEIGDLGEVLRRRNEETVVIVQIETARGLSSIDDIAAIPGIDVVWLGHYDLSISMGLPGRFKDPNYLSAVDDVVGACSEAGTAAGILVAGHNEAEEAIDRGFRCVAVGSDVEILTTGLTDRLRRMHPS